MTREAETETTPPRPPLRPRPRPRHPPSRRRPRRPAPRADAPQTRAVAARRSRRRPRPSRPRRRARPRCTPRPSAPAPRSGTASPPSRTRRASSASPARSPTTSSPAAPPRCRPRRADRRGRGARRAGETRPHVRTGGLDAGETRRAAVEAALLHRYDPGRYALSEPAREWRGLSLIEMARGLLEAEGVRVRGLSRDEIATRALHSTSDFPAILAGVTNKTLRDAYETAPRTFPAIARRTTAADFKLIHRLQLGEAPQLEKVNESGEFKRGTIGEAQETYRVETLGKVIGITRQVIINDDLDAFTRVPALFGTSAATLEATSSGASSPPTRPWPTAPAVPRQPQEPRRNRRRPRRRRPRQGAGRDGEAARARRQDRAQHPPGLPRRAVALELTAEQLIAQNLVPAKSGDVVPSRSARSRSSPSPGSIRPRARCRGTCSPARRRSTPSSTPTSRARTASPRDPHGLRRRRHRDQARLDFGAKAIDWRGSTRTPASS